MSPLDPIGSGESTSSDDLVGLLRTGGAPREIRAFASRGLLPLDPHDSLRALLAVIRDPDADVEAAALETLTETPPDRLARFVRESGPAPEELDVLARRVDDPFVLEEVVRARTVRDDTLLFLAETASGRPQEALIANQARLLTHPDLVEALRRNPSLSADGRRLLSELTEEFIEKEARRRQAAEARASEAAEADTQPAEQLSDDDPDLAEDLFVGAESDASESAPTDQISEAESLFIGAIYKRIGQMNVSQKIKLAYTGSKEERHILIGDTNKLIGIAVLKSRSISVNEVEGFAAMRNLDEEVYRRIAGNREWMRKPAVALALVRNPRVPLDLTLPLLKQLPVRELRVIFRDRNLAPVLRQSARRLLVLKRR